MNGGDEREALGQLNSLHCPPPHNSLLGEALDIAEVAKLLGCSPWTVRQKYLPQGSGSDA